MVWKLTAAVGLTDAGTQCPNKAFDQQQVAELLDAVGMPAGGTSLDDLPPIEEGFASPELCEAIRNFQSVQALTQDARVDIGGTTWQQLVSIVHPDSVPLGGVPLMLNVADFEVIELPQSAIDLPSLTYTLRGPVATFEGGGIRIELSINGPVKVAWSNAFPLACQMSPDFAALESAVASGAARAIGGAALDQLCSQVKLESRASIGRMFSAISLKVGLDGVPILGGSIGDEQGFTSLEFDPIGRALIYKVTRRLQQAFPVTGGETQVSGGVELQLKVTTQDDDQASAIAALVTIVAVGVVLFPVAEWAAGSEVVGGLGAGARQLIIRLGMIH